MYVEKKKKTKKTDFFIIIFDKHIQKSNIIETDRIEFKLNLPCSQYLRRKTIDS